MAWTFRHGDHVDYAYADTEKKRKAIEKATSANHPLCNQPATPSGDADDDTIRIYYGLK